MKEKHIFWFDEIGKEANVLVGKKCANLGEMTKLNMPVPKGFAISVTAHERFLEEPGARQEIAKLLTEAGDLKDFKISADVSTKYDRSLRAKRFRRTCDSLSYHTMKIYVQDATTKYLSR
jgi:pyruvate,water dikinase